MSDTPKPESPAPAKRSLTLSDDDVVVRRSDRERAVAQVGGGRSPSAKVATDPQHGAARPHGGGAGSDPDAA